MPHIVAGLKSSRLDDPAINTGPACFEKRPGKSRSAHTGGKRVAGRAGRRCLKHDIAQMKLVAHRHIPIIQVFDNEVFAECSERHGLTKFGTPPIKRHRSFEQNRLIRPAVMFLVADSISNQTKLIDQHRAGDLCLVDAGLVALSGQSFRLADADREKFHAGLGPSVFPFNRHMG